MKLNLEEQQEGATDYCSVKWLKKWSLVILCLIAAMLWCKWKKEQRKEERETWLIPVNIWDKFLRCEILDALKKTWLSIYQKSAWISFFLKVLNIQKWVGLVVLCQLFLFTWHDLQMRILELWIQLKCFQT